MKNKYYYGYALNPEETRNDDFFERTKIKCVLIYNGEEYRELYTDAKLFLVNGQEVIDGKKVFEEDASLIGNLDKEITIEDVVNFQYKKGLDEREYLNLLIKLISITREFAIRGAKEYLELEQKFIETFKTKRK